MYYTVKKLWENTHELIMPLNLTLQGKHKIHNETVDIETIINLNQLNMNYNTRSATSIDAKRILYYVKYAYVNHM